MRFHFLWVILLLLVQGCGAGNNDAPKAMTAREEVPPKLWDKEGLAEARAIYERSCGSCHDPGAGDAPTIGVKADWDGRSRIWVAVLTEHAKQGYLGMPARGGAQELTDKQVGAAAEFMMSVTYSELPLD